MLRSVTVIHPSTRSNTFPSRVCFSATNGVPTESHDSRYFKSTSGVAATRRNIAHITGPMNLVMSQEREAGYLAALTKAGIEPQPQLVVHGNFQYSSGQAGIRALVGRGSAFSAVFCANDEMALGAVNELRGLGLRVPEDISIVGFDDLVFAESCDPPLTTIRQPRRAIGSESMRMMIALLAGEPTGVERIEARVELIERASTARAKTARLRSK